MARNKNSTALFDVIHSAKKPPRPSPSASIPTPKWWGKGKTLPKPPAVEPSENVGKQRSWLSAAKRNGVAPASPLVPVAPVVAESVIVEPVEPVAIEQASAAATIEPEEVSAPAPVVTEPRPRFIDRFKSRSVEAPVVVEEPAPTPEFSEQVPPEPISEPPADEIKPEKPDRSHRNRDRVMALDSAAGDIRFRLSYAGLVAVGFIFVLLLAIAFIAGTKMPTQTAADDSDVSTKSPTTAPTSGLMVAVDPADSGTDISKPFNSVPVQSDVLLLPAHTAKPAVAATPPAPALPIKATREIGMVYVVVQSYAEQDLAQKACDFVNHAGIPCSLVQGPSNWAPRDWYSVIGLQPFAKHDPGLAEYEKAVRLLGVKFTSHAIDQFQPAAYTWREDSDMSQQ